MCVCVCVCIDMYNMSILESCYVSRICIESTAVWCCQGYFPSEARSSIHSELLYADDLFLIAPIMEPLGRCITE